VYDRPYQEEPEASAAISKIMAALDWKALLAKVEDSMERWRVPTAVLYGNKARRDCTAARGALCTHRPTCNGTAHTATRPCQPALLMATDGAKAPALVAVTARAIGNSTG
jgi:hypothetical protein